MVEYVPIGDLVARMPADAWDLLAQIDERRRGLLLCELLGQRPQPRRNDKPLAGTRLANHPDNPRRGPV